MTVKITSEEVINGKFTKTLSLIDGFYFEMKNRTANNIMNSIYTNTIASRLKEISAAIHEEIQKLAKDIEIK